MLLFPYEIWLHIAKFLSIKDLYRLSLTCKQTLPLWREQSIWLQLLEHDFQITAKHAKKRNEYIAAHLFQLGNNEKDILKSINYFKQVRNHLMGINPKTEIWAKFALGCIDLNGWDGKKNISRGLRYLKHCLEQDYYPAIHELFNFCHGDLRFLTIEQQKGFKTMLRKKIYQRAQKNNAAALLDLGTSYHKGILHSKNFQRAIDHFRSAAEAGKLEAYCRIGAVYEEWEKPIDAIIAYKQGLDAGNYMANVSLGKLYETQGKIKTARGFYIKAYKAGIKSAAINIALMYYQSNYFNRELVERWATTAESDGNPTGSYLRGLLHYEQGHITEALPLFQTAAEKGEATAAFVLATHYYKASDTGKALTYYQLAYLLGKTDSLEAIVDLIVNSYQKISDKDFAQSLFWTAFALSYRSDFKKKIWDLGKSEKTRLIFTLSHIISNSKISEGDIDRFFKQLKSTLPLFYKQVVNTLQEFSPLLPTKNIQNILQQFETIMSLDSFTPSFLVRR